MTVLPGCGVVGTWKHFNRGAAFAMVVAAGCSSQEGNPKVAQLTAGELQSSMSIPGSTTVPGALPAGSSSASAPQITDILLPDGVGVGVTFQVTVSFHTGTAALARLRVEIEGATSYLELTVQAVPNSDGTASFPCRFDPPASALSAEYTLLTQLVDSDGTAGVIDHTSLSVDRQSSSCTGAGCSVGGDSDVGGGDGALLLGDSTSSDPSPPSAPVISVSLSWHQYPLTPGQQTTAVLELGTRGGGVTGLGTMTSSSVNVSSDEILSFYWSVSDPSFRGNSPFFIDIWADANTNTTCDAAEVFSIDGQTSGQFSTACLDQQCILRVTGSTPPAVDCTYIP